jgi:predicted neutral ceramidase superfamily lipid hydrolase
MTLSRYSQIVSAVALGSLALLVLGSRGALQPGSLWAIALGAGLAASNGIAAYALVRWSTGRSNQTFMRAVLGGTAARMTLLLACVAAAIALGGFPPAPLVASLLAYFVLFLVMELVVLGVKPPARAETR